MTILIEKGGVFNPAPLGKAELIDASDYFVAPGLIDPHEHLLGGSGEEGFSSQTPELHLSEIVCAASEAFIEDSNRSIQLVGKEAQD